MKLMLLMYFEFLISLYFWLTNLSCRREPLANQAVERNICFPVTASQRKAPKSRRNCLKLDDSVRRWIEKEVDGRKCLESEGSVENRTMAFKISKFSCFHLFRVPSKVITHHTFSRLKVTLRWLFIFTAYSIVMMCSLLFYLKSKPTEVSKIRQ